MRKEPRAPAPWSRPRPARRPHRTRPGRSRGSGSSARRSRRAERLDVNAQLVGGDAGQRARDLGRRRLLRGRNGREAQQGERPHPDAPRARAVPWVRSRGRNHRVPARSVRRRSCAPRREPPRAPLRVEVRQDQALDLGLMRHARRGRRERWFAVALSSGKEHSATRSSAPRASCTSASHSFVSAGVDQGARIRELHAPGDRLLVVLVLGAGEVQVAGLRSRRVRSRPARPRWLRGAPRRRIPERGLPSPSSGGCRSVGSAARRRRPERTCRRRATARLKRCGRRCIHAPPWREASQP